MKSGLFLAENTFLSRILGYIAHSSLKRTFERDALFVRVKVRDW